MADMFVYGGRFVATAVTLVALNCGVRAEEEKPAAPAAPATPAVPKDEKPAPAPAATPDAPKVETSKAETPVAEAPKTDALKAETPKVPATELTAVPPVPPKDPNAPPPILFSKDPDAPPPADIFAAAKGGDLEAVKQFVERDPATLQQKTQLSDTALHWAASCGHTDIVKFLLSKGSDPNLRNIAGATPLHLAARKAYVGVMAALIHSKCDLNVKNFLEDGEETPLHIAIQKGNLEAIEMLLKAGADANARMTDGTRPLDIAEKAPTSDIRKLLVKYKGTSNSTEEE